MGRASTQTANARYRSAAARALKPSNAHRSRVQRMQRDRAGGGKRAAVGQANERSYPVCPAAWGPAQSRTRTTPACVPTTSRGRRGESGGVLTRCLRRRRQGPKMHALAGPETVVRPRAAPADGRTAGSGAGGGGGCGRERAASTENVTVGQAMPRLASYRAFAAG